MDMRDGEPAELRRMKPLAVGDGAGIDEKQVERLRTAWHKADRGIVEPAGEGRDTLCPEPSPAIYRAQ